MKNSSFPDGGELNAGVSLKSIQDAIDAAQDGDTVIVEQGKYLENIDFKGKTITLRSRDPEDPAAVAATIIDGSGKGSVVTFKSHEGENSVLSGLTITNGSADLGGGVYCAPWTKPRILNNRIVGNKALRGGGIYCAHFPTISRNTIASNQADLDGGGVFADISSRPLIASNFIVRNAAGGRGGGIYCSSFFLGTIVNNTIADNSSPDYGGGVYCDFLATPSIGNCILWGNGDDIAGWGGNYCCIEDTGGENEGKGNIHADPRFVNRARGDYHLLAGSPCIGGGSAKVVSVPAFDFDGEATPTGDVVDIGADQFVDSDSDALPDLWEKKWFQNLSAVADADPDSDGLPNSGEMVAGSNPANPDTDGDRSLDGAEVLADTDPLDAKSLFKVLMFSILPARVSLRWTTVPGRWYETYFSDDLQSWTVTGEALKATGDSLQSTITLATPVSRRFLRVKVLPK